MSEFCHNRERDPTGAWCGKPAEFIVWGCLYPDEAVGPRCYECAADQIGATNLAGHALEQSAIFVLSSVVPKTELDEARAALDPVALGRELHRLRDARLGAARGGYGIYFYDRDGNELHVESGYKQLPTDEEVYAVTARLALAGAHGDGD